MKINNLFKIVFILMLVLTLSNLVLADEIDSKNGEILNKLLSIDNISVSTVEITTKEIFVSIEVSDISSYDDELIGWWGTIFSVASLLKNEGAVYETVTIENLLDGEPYYYISTNMVSIVDYQNNIILDHEFWEESLVSASRPSYDEVVEAANFPTKLEVGTNWSDVIVGIIKIIVGVLLLVGIIVLIVFGIKHFKKQKKHKKDVKKVIKKESKKDVKEEPVADKTVVKKTEHKKPAKPNKTISNAKKGMKQFGSDVKEDYKNLKVAVKPKLKSFKGWSKEYYRINVTEQLPDKTQKKSKKK